jgi:DNA-binding NtrC family response regulator
MEETKVPAFPILLVDDEEQALFSASVTLNSAGFNHIVECQDSRDVMSLLSQQDFSVIVLDMLMPHVSGWELLPKIVQDYPSLPVIIVTAVNEVEAAVVCMDTGAFYYLVKPEAEANLVPTLKRAIEFRALRDENTLLKQYLLSNTLNHPEAFVPIITQDKGLQSIFQYAEAIAKSPLPVLITGETGVGKELLARALHQLSGRKGEFVPINTAGVDDQLFSDTLFGHEKGAFTGAEKARKGLIEQANGGTLFLDEIGEMHLESQVKLLRLLQDGKYYPLGCDVSRLANARMVVATNQPIESLMNSGKFRKDLYYRLQTHQIRLPSLRERREDIPLLVAHFLEKAADTLGVKTPTPPRELFTLLNTYHFPGNIRELESMTFDAVIRHTGGVLSMESFREKIGDVHSTHPLVGTAQAASAEDSELIFPEILPSVKAVEQLLIAEAMKRSDGNQTIAAQLVGLSRKAFGDRLKKGRT